MSRRILLLRHGERLDEIGQSSNTFDPGLSANGMVQAKEAWRGISKSCGSKMAIYSSPMTRTLETAAPPGIEVVEATWSVKIVPGLASCAAAVAQYGGIRGKHLPDPVLKSQDLLERAKSINPSVDFSFIDDSSSDSGLSQYANASELYADKQFLNAVLACVADADPSQLCVIVTHREGIRSLARKLTEGMRRPHTSYCCVASFHVEVGDGGGTPPPPFQDWWYEDCWSFEEFGANE
mmetsp:Transcript_18634/g.34540  ORF Transcript_18634/g.34540 Transcript_18634/m.34540 type:complete len:237 (+) Transcript_18634:213-923(+)